MDTVRVLAADAVEKVGNGHPGTAISLAPAAYLLYQNVMRHDPADPHWLGRDRFVLSAGHSSLTQYIQLYLAGFGLEIEDLRRCAPGAPRPRATRSTSTRRRRDHHRPAGPGPRLRRRLRDGPRRERGLLDPDAAPAPARSTTTVYVIASDGDLQEGVTSEASSIAGHQELGNLIVLWDDNHISIEGDTDIAFTEDVLARYEAYGWHTQRVDWTAAAATARTSTRSHAAIDAAKAETEARRSSALRTIIAWPTPPSRTPARPRLEARRRGGQRPEGACSGFDPEKTFEVDADVLAHTRAALGARGRRRRPSGRRRSTPGAPRTRRTRRCSTASSPASCPTAGPTRCPCSRPARRVATRAASGKVLTALGAVLPELWGGSADLAGSNNTTMEGEPSFVPAKRSTHEFAGDPFGRTLHFGIREHAMGAILTGIRAARPDPPVRRHVPQFSDYMRGAVRLASLMGVPAIYVWTHDSIGLGEDGPTHQPVEHLAALRAIPGLTSCAPPTRTRPPRRGGDPRAHQRPGRPRPHAAERAHVPARRGRVRAGRRAWPAVRYVLLEASSGTPDVILIGTGSEVQLAVEARETLEADGVPTRVVSVRRSSGSTSRTRTTASRCSRPSVRPGSRSRRASRCRGTSSSATPAARSRSSTTAPRPTTRRSSGSSASRPRPSSPPRTSRSRRPAATGPAAAPARPPTSGTGDQQL